MPKKLLALALNMSPRSKPSPPIEPRVEEGRKDCTDLQFLTFTDFDQTTTRETKRKIRSHVMSQVHSRRMRNRKWNEKEAIVLDLSGLPISNGSPLEGLNSSMLIRPVLLHPYDLGAGRSDPFVRYPIEMSARNFELFNQCKVLFSRNLQKEIFSDLLLKCSRRIVLRLSA
jgi:hypothetical protein